MQTFTIQVPASTANLGPAFDTMGLALGLYLTVRGSFGPEIEQGRILTTGNAAGNIPTNPEENLICQVAARTATACGVNLPPLALEIANDIPLSGGLGSSAAAIVAGVSIVEAVRGEEFSPAEFLRHAMVFENHADNLAPARFGGWITLCTFDDGQPVFFKQRSWPATVKIVVVHPHFPLSTEKMRAALPTAIPRGDVIFQMQRVLLLTTALEENRPDLLRAALQDRLHQPFRAPHVPGLEDILKLNLPGLLGTALSGAGPSALALVTDQAEEIASAMQACFARHGHSSTPYLLKVDPEGRKLTQE